MANTKIPSELIPDDAITAAHIDSTATGMTLADLTVDTNTLHVDSTNNRVGVGTTSPAAELHVSGDSIANTFKLIANSSVSGSDATIFRPADNTMAFSTNGTERARITSDGYFLVGTTSVASTTLDGTGGSNNAVVIGAENTAYPVLVLQSSHQRWLADYITNDGSLRTYNTTSNYETMVTDTSGRVTFPKQPHVQGSVTTNNNSNSTAKDFTAGTYSRGTLSVNVVSNQARFTAPVAGLYLVLFATIMGTDTSRRDAYILVNGTTIAQSLNDVASGYHYRQMAQVLDLSANDYVTFGADNWYDNTSTGYTVWRTASMTLIG